jgi:hypothetical protein
MISKYPPIQGGVSARTYWLANGFAEKGIETHVITNANCVEKEYMIQDAYSGTTPNLHIHFIEPEIPWHIPDSKLYVPRLLDKALQVIRENKIDLIDTGYLVPYALVNAHGLDRAYYFYRIDRIIGVFMFFCNQYSLHLPFGPVHHQSGS